MIMPRHRPCTNFIHHPSTRTYPSSSAAKPSRTKIAFRRRRLRLRLPKHQEMDGVHGVFPSEQASIDEKHHNKKRKWAPPVSQFLKLPNKLISGVLDLDRRKFRSQTSDNMERWKAEQGRGIEKRKIRRKKSRRERVRRQKMQMREKVGKSRNTVFFQWFVAPEGRKVGSLKRRVRSQLATGEMKNCTPLWREAHFQVKMYKTHHGRSTFGSWDVEKVHAVVARSTFPAKMYKTHHGRSTFGSWDVEKVHAVVARSTFPSQNVQNTPAPDHFWKLRCLKSARRCGAKHISKSKVLKTDGLGPLLEVQMSKKCRKSARRCGAKHISKSKV